MARQTTRHYKLGGLAVVLVTVLVVLKAMSQMLRVPSGYGIEDLLGWVDTAVTAQLIDLWRHPPDQALSRAWLSVPYLTLDTAIFVPVYSAFFLGAWHESRRMLMRHSSRSGTWAWWLASGGAALVVTLALVDLLENLAGLYRLGYAWTMAPALLAAVGVGHALRHLIDPDWLGAVLSDAIPSRPWRGIGMLAIVGLGPAAFIVWKSGGFAPSHCASSDDLLAWGCAAHALKDWLALALVLGPVALVAWVQFGPHADAREWAGIVEARGALADTVWRSRYVIAAVGVCFALLVLMNQGQDVVYAMVSHPWTQGLSGWTSSLQTLAVLAATAVSLWIFGFACWLWTRLGVQVSRRADPERTGPASAQDWFARNWARAWGVAPAALIVWLTLKSLPQAVLLPHDKGPIIVLILFAVWVIAGAIAFVWRRDKLAVARHQSAGAAGAADAADAAGDLYYANVRLRDLLVKSDNHKLFGCVTPTWLPVVALTLGLSFRALGLFAPADWQLPTLTLPIMLCLVTFWLSLAGWISLYEHSESVPWLLFGLVWIGALGFLGAADNHRVPLGDNGVIHHPGAAFAMALLMGAWLIGALLLLLREMQAEAPRQWVSWSLVVVLIGLELGTMLLSDHVLGDERVGDRSVAIGKPGKPAKSLTPVSARDALDNWLGELCNPKAATAGASPPATGAGAGAGAGACDASSKGPVYIVVSEGGGIRSAYWTALAMSEIAAGDPRFDQRTFAAAGVSGGAVGLAVYRACQGLAMSASHALAASPDKRSEAVRQEMRECVDRFGATDLLAPLVGAWFFEDALARWLPSMRTICSAPGCGFMSRGLWFENAMSKAVDPTGGGLTTGILESRSELVEASGRHTPYLMLNSTLVETGERVVASDMVIDWGLFPGARDEAALLGHVDIPLVTAAHNSSRFPFTNALGAIETFTTRCSPNAYLERASEASGERRHCGHLADGGIFDNGAGHSATDVLRLMRACLGDWLSESSEACPKLPLEKRKALAEGLDVKLLLIRNGTPFRHGGVFAGSNQAASKLPLAPCDPPAPLKAAYLQSSRQPPTFDTLAQPRCASNGALFIDVIGPIIAAFNAIGTGSNGRTALARAPTVATGAEAIALQEGGSPAWRRLKMPAVSVRSIDLENDGPLFPLGWHLAPSARTEMRRRAEIQASAFLQPQTTR